MADRDKYTSSSLSGSKDVDKDMARMLGQAPPSSFQNSRTEVTLAMGKKCASCNQNIVGKYLEINGSQYCSKCGELLNKRSTSPRKAVPKTFHQYVSEDSKRQAEQSRIQSELHGNVQQGKESCKWCRKVITGEAIPYKGDLYHEECFTCSVCANPIEGGGFVERDGLLFCKSCHGGATASSSNVCGRCNQNISGTYTAALGKYFHADCFVCAGCSGSLSGGYALKDDQPVCEKCVKNKIKIPAGGGFHGPKKAGFTVDPRSGKKTIV